MIAKSPHFTVVIIIIIIIIVVVFTINTDLLVFAILAETFYQIVERSSSDASEERTWCVLYIPRQKRICKFSTCILFVLTS